ncbi:MAG: S8 family serine peptidase [Elusimicrobiota bacterium]
MKNKITELILILLITAVPVLGNENFSKQERTHEYNIKTNVLESGWKTVRKGFNYLYSLFKNFHNQSKKSPLSDFYNSSIKDYDEEKPSVAVVVTQANFKNPSLKKHVWINMDEIPNNKKDDDNNGYPDDMIGRDIRHNQNIGDPLPYQDYNYGNQGTQLAKEIVNSANGNVNIMYLYGLGGGFLDKRTPVQRDIAESIRYAADNEADVINLSQNYYYMSNKYVTEAIKYAKSKGAIIVASAGDGGKNTVKYPATLDDVIAVGAVAENGKIHKYSNKGSNITIYAPVSLSGKKQKYEVTHRAAGRVSGVVSQIKHKNPLLTSREIKTLLKENADTESGIPVLNPQKTIDAAPTVEETITETYVKTLGREPTEHELNVWKERAMNKETNCYEFSYKIQLTKGNIIENKSTEDIKKHQIIKSKSLPLPAIEKIMPYRQNTNNTNKTIGK